MTITIHWLGAGLSSAPGIKKLSEGKTSLIVWNRSLDKAKKNLAGVNVDIRELSIPAISETLNAGDIVVSMLPATMHLTIANLCLEYSAHFVSSSYISPEMAALNDKALSKDLCFVNEVGLDPGLDHLLAHDLVARYEASDALNNDNQLSFRSYCGGFPKVANEFKYKFSWSPLGVLKALKSPAKWLANGKVNDSQAPWEALSDYTVQLKSEKETFIAYPNRDSLPFIKQYMFKPEWRVEEFVRGTLRLSGWSTAWQYLFDRVAELTSGKYSQEEADQELTNISKELEEKYSYDSGEADRVVLSVELEAKRNGKTVWHQSYLMDEAGNNKGQAMARLVSLPVSIAIESIVNNQATKGVSAAPHQQAQVQSWLDELSALGEEIIFRDHIS